MRLRSFVVLVVSAAVGVAALVLTPYWTAAALILRAANAGGALGTFARWSGGDVTEELVSVSTRTGTTRGRLFRPDGRARGKALLISGVHPDGIEDDRLIKLARELAATGIGVLTPEIEDLVRFRLTPRVTDIIEDSSLWMLEQPGLSGSGRVGLIGVSFSGGLAIVAAGRPAIRDRVAYVVSFGGHGNLPRVLEFLSGGSGATRRPHDYSVAIVLHHAADLAVPEDQAAQLRAGIETFLSASALDRTQPHEAQRLFRDAKALEASLPEPSASLMRLVNERDVSALGERLRPVLPSLPQHPALSPDRSPPPSAPVYLLHGADDTVIPASEAAQLATHLAGKAKVRLLVSRFLTHVDVANAPGAQETWNMIDFWRAVLAEY